MFGFFVSRYRGRIPVLTLMSRIERKYCLISNSYWTGLVDVPTYFIFERISCVLVNFY